VDVYPYYNTAAAGAVSFQILLLEGSNQIIFQYKDVDGGAGTYGTPVNNTDKGVTATIGVEDSAGAVGKKYSLNGSTLLRNNLALLMTPGMMVWTVAPSGQPTVFQPSAPLAVSSGASRNDYTVNVNLNTVAKVSGACPSGSWYNKDRDTCYDHETVGLLQDFRDGELSGLLGFRLGIMQLNNTDGGTVVKHFNAKDTTGWASLMAATRGQTPTTEAPLAEALYEATGYFKEDTAFRFANNDWTQHTGACPATGTNYDPFCFQSAAQKVPCVKSYVLLVSSGNYSHDNTTNIFGAAANNETWSNTWSLGWRTTDDTGSEGTFANGGWLDNVAYKAHTTDWRSDLEGFQNLTLYVVNTFSSGASDGAGILKKAALYGGFKDANNNNAYDSGEDDPNSPKTYQEASGGNIKAKIINAVTDILKNSASGTSVSVLSTSAGGEGALYQAYFYPARQEGQTEDRKWPGFLRAFFLDRYQNLRDDYSGSGTSDAHLTPLQDRFAEMELVAATNEVQVNLFYDTNGDSKLSAAERAANSATPKNNPPSVTMDTVASIWEAGKKLALRDKSQRNIYLWLDSDKDGAVGNGDFSSLGGEALAFTTANATTLKPYLRAGVTMGTDADGNPITLTTTDQEAENLINFVRGNQVLNNYNQEYRGRCLSISGASQETGCSESTQRVWPLGDIVYSTPTLAAAPGEKFDQIYGDASYRTFATTYKDRRQVVYVGANDGLLHAFNAGVYHTGDDPDSGGTDTGWFTANPSSGNGWGSVGLGDELWAFVPYDNLPHLAWLACNGSGKDPATCGDNEYTHVYYVDHRPKVTDAQIFSNDSTHPNGWGTILILPLRLGGGAINVDLNGDGDTADAGEQSFRSAYYAFDVTDPEQKPKLLWRFTSSTLGFTTSYPAIVRVKDKDDSTVKWYMVVGSGPQNNPGSPASGNRDYGMSSTTQSGRIFVVDLETGSLVKTFTTETNAGLNQYVGTTPSPVTNVIMGDPTVVDVDLDFSADVVYLGSAVSATSGRIFRINTKRKSNPANWVLSSLFDPDPGATSSDPDDVTGSTPKDMGPLLVAPSVSKDIYGNLWVFFGTGRLRNSSDLSNSDQQRFYGIKDKCWDDVASAKCSGSNTSAGEDGRLEGEGYAYKWADLFDSSSVAVAEPTGANGAAQVTDGGSGSCGGEDSDTTTAGVQCSYQKLLTTVRAKKGWYINLNKPSGSPAPPSERVLSRGSVLGGLVLFTTYQPTSDLCSILGNSYLYGLYYETGTAYNKPIMPGDPADANTTVEHKYSLGLGMPTSVGVAIGETVTGFVQKSTGEIIRIETAPGLGVRSGAAAWREKSDGGGTVEIETIYKHIVK
jgi:type IV pilus assembly protein PilY1